MFSIVIATIQIHATRVAFNWEIQMLILKFGFQILQSNMKCGNGFHLWEIRPQGGFPFYRSIGKSEKGFAKLFSWTVVFFLLIMHACARLLFLRTVFQILFQISQSNGKNGNLKQISQHDLSVEIGILKSKSRFPNQTCPKAFKSLMNNNINNKNDPIWKDQGSI